jgi:hypothetical protein
MRAVRWVVFFAIIAATVGCTKERPPRPTPDDANPAAAPDPVAAAPATPVIAPVTPPFSAAPSRDRDVQDITEAQFEALLIAVAPCEISSRGISRDCEPYQAYRVAKRRRGPIDKPWREVDRVVATRLLAHEDAAVRFVAAELLGPMLQAKEDQLRPLIEATRREVHPGVVKSFVKRLGPSTYRNDDVRELMMILGGHLDDVVRIEVAVWLTGAQGRGRPELLKRAMTMVRKDPSERVRLRVLEDLGDPGDDMVLPFLERYLRAPYGNGRSHASAVRALLNMWSSPIPKPAPSRAAYRRTLKLLMQTPRTELSPPWAALGGLRWVTEPRFVAQASWFDLAALTAALDGLITDLSANPKARKAAVELLIHYAEPRAHFASLLAVYTARTDPEIQASAAVVELLRSAADPAAPPPSARPRNVVPPGVPIPMMPKLPPVATP